MPKTKPLVPRLRAARILLREWRKGFYDSERIPFGMKPHDVSPEAAHELSRFDSADAALAEAIESISRKTA